MEVKVCGLTRVDEAVACARAGVDWLGLNFHPPSPRCVSTEVAAEIVRALPSSCTPVGLFVNRSPAEIRAVAEKAGFRVVQLHGDEPPDILQSLADLTIIRAFRIGSPAAVDELVAYLERAHDLGRVPDHVLVDGYVAGQAGGTGHAIGLDLLDRLPPLPGLILAGGLTPENVADRIARVHPWMVDVASGVESSPGRKDPARVAAFVAAARSVAVGEPDAPLSGNAVGLV